MKHNQITKYFYLLVFLLFITGCDVSSLSDEEITDLSIIKAEIIIKETYNGSNEIKVFLSDGCKQIISKNIKVKVNGNLLELWVIDELYYTTKSYYTNYTTKPNVFHSEEIFPRSNSYYFEIILPDSTVYPLAYIKPINKSDMDSIQINIPEIISRDKNFVLKWQNLNINHPVQLTIDKYSENKEIKENDTIPPPTIISLHKTINATKGQYVIPTSFFEDALTIAEFFKIKINYENSGLINPELIRGSNILYEFILKKDVIRYENNQTEK